MIVAQKIHFDKLKRIPPERQKKACFLCGLQPVSLTENQPRPIAGRHEAGKTRPVRGNRYVRCVLGRCVRDRCVRGRCVRGRCVRLISTLAGYAAPAGYSPSLKTVSWSCQTTANCVRKRGNSHKSAKLRVRSREETMRRMREQTPATEAKAQLQPLRQGALRLKLRCYAPKRAS